MYISSPVRLRSATPAHKALLASPAQLMPIALVLYASTKTIAILT